MNEEQLTNMLTRLMNNQDSQLELLTALQSRVGQLEQASAIRDQVMEKARQVVGLHNDAINVIGAALADVHEKMKLLNANEAELQTELLRQRELLSQNATGRPPATFN